MFIRIVAAGRTGRSETQTKIVTRKVPMKT